MSDQQSGRCGFCAIVGRPNVGKSTLLNRLIGQKLAITSHKPQTTRHSILGVKTTESAQIVYVDTPGIHKRGDHAMNRYLNRTARSALSDVDLILFVVEALRWTDEDQAVLDALSRLDMPVLLVVNKIDTVKNKEALLPYLENLAGKFDFTAVIPLSARKGNNLEPLEKQVIACLPEGEHIFPDDQLTDRSERFFAAELVREQLTRRYAKEIPYALTVEIEKFDEEGNLYRIDALIWVERQGQKNIIIGAKGEALKEVGTQARKEMEKFFDKKVFLQLWVKVKKGWSSDEGALSRLGYSD
ncbi:GTPase Era [Sedimenticola selenatireducens]|uniref:GTPase Era n=1 Tax=Sedimenticola selenatireducens TaxID=191960 RepID=A0A2N6CZY6_9GAMM|nr:GTPase Era [Sedimenticola selenatireducens]PLX62984.1 MAG: GTPase Era [Sedimenticola selenatireducens]